MAEIKGVKVYINLYDKHGNSVGAIELEPRLVDGLPKNGSRKGELVLNTQDSKLYFWDGSTWKKFAIDPHAHVRADITDFFASPFWDNIPDKPSTFPPDLHASAHAKGGSDELSLDASQITSGVFDLARIPNIDWSRIQDNFPRYAEEIVNKISMQGWLEFDGEDDYVQLPGAPFDLDKMTIVAIFRASNVTNTGRIFQRAPTTWGLHVESGKLCFYVDTSDDGGMWKAVTTPIEAGRTYCGVGVYDGNEMRLYVDGNLVNSVGQSGLVNDGGTYAWIGSSGSSDTFFNGKIYIVMIYNRALSDSEIQQIYDDPLNPPTDGLVLWLDGTSIDYANGIWYDKSGNGNHGTIYGATLGGFPVEAHTHSIRDAVINDSIVPSVDNTYDLGTSSLRWRNAYIVNLYTGDVVFQNGWKITEFDENGKLMDGLRILDKNGEELFKITKDGLYFKGKKIA